MTNTARAHANAALAVQGTQDLQIGKKVASLWGEIGAAVKLIFKKPAIGVAVAAMWAATENSSKGSIVVSATRDEQTTIAPQYQGYNASITTYVGGDQTFNASATHLWGNYYAISAHQLTAGSSFGSIFRGNDYVNDPGVPMGIERIDVSPYSDLAIITASMSYDVPRDPNSRLVGLAVAWQEGGGTIINYFAAESNLQFINQVTGANITRNDVLSGNSIFAAPVAGMLVNGIGYGAWGNRNGPVNNPDGRAGQWMSTISGTPTWGSEFGYDNPNLYFLSKNTEDPLGGIPAALDSGSPIVTVVPEPSNAGLLLVGTAGYYLYGRRSRRRE